MFGATALTFPLQNIEIGIKEIGTVFIPSFVRKGRNIWQDSSLRAKAESILKICTIVSAIYMGRKSSELIRRSGSTMRTHLALIAKEDFDAVKATMAEASADRRKKWRAASVSGLA